MKPLDPKTFEIMEEIFTTWAFQYFLRTEKAWLKNLDGTIFRYPFMKFMETVREIKFLLEKENGYKEKEKGKTS